jgi:hypothetical protein
MRNALFLCLGFVSSIVAAACSDEAVAPPSQSPDANLDGAVGDGPGISGDAGADRGGSAADGTLDGRAADASGDATRDLSGDLGPGDDAGGDDAITPDDATPDRAPDDDGGFPADARIGSCSPLNWFLSASSSAASDPASNAIDGIQGTRWSTGVGQSPGAWFQIDFDGYVQLSQISLDNTGSPGDHPRGYDVLTSRDGVDFSNVIASGMPGDVAPPNNVVTIDFAPRAVRTLRIQLSGSSGSWWSIQDLRLACQLPDGDGGFTTDVVPDDLRCGPGTATDAGVPDAMATDSGSLDARTSDGEGGGALAEGGDAAVDADGAGVDAGGVDGGRDPFNRANWSLSASSTSTNPTDAIANAIDGNIATRWSSGQAQVPGQFFRVDLGSVGCVGQIRLVASGTDFIAAYRISVSVDDVKYVPIAQGIGSNVMQIRLPPHRARFVRIEDTGASGSWWSIDEIVILP